MPEAVPTLVETALGAFLHDVGKFWQRAAGSQDKADPEVREMASQALPQRDGRPTHIHALWTWQFFHWMEKHEVRLPGVDRNRVRNLAGYHHRPGGGPREEEGAQHLVAEADRLAAGLDRAARKDQEAETSARWDAFIRTPLQSPFSSVFLHEKLGAVEPTYIPLGRLTPAAAQRGERQPDTSDYQQRYQELLEGFLREFRQVARLPHGWLFQSSLKSLCERYWHAVPSSTIDQPDVSLYDHSRAAAAIAAALYAWHEFHGELSEEALARTREEAKFVWILGDLSGIQSALFRMQHQQVRGAAKILRARSFLMSLITESAALDLLQRLGLTPFSLLQSAGGRFLILAAAVPHTAEMLEAVRRDVEQWMLERWRGELALHLSMTESFSSRLFQRDSFHEMTAMWREAAESAKQRPFASCYQPVWRKDTFEHGPCAACGVRPAVGESQGSEESPSCLPCQEERTLGGDLPRLQVIAWSREAVGGASRNLKLWNGWHIHWHLGSLGVGQLEDGFVVGDSGNSQLPPLAVRFLPHYVPVLKAEEADQMAYRACLSDEARETRPGQIKTFEHIALDALEERDGKLYGEDFLAVIKADVDRLGAVFSQGVRAPSLGLAGGLSRMMDFFFSARLPYLLASDERFRSTYVVYAGGDDLLLIGPWRQSLSLLCELQSQFAAFVSNPQLTLSAALELVHPDEPLNRSVREAEERLERAKSADRNRVCAIDPVPMEWPQFRRQVENAEELLGWMRNGKLSQGFVYRMLNFDADRVACQSNRADAHAASWRARWGYQLRRNLKDEAIGSSPLVAFLNRLLGLDPQLEKEAAPPSARCAITAALYRTRSF